MCVCVCVDIMAKMLRAQAILLEDPDPIPSTHMVTTVCNYRSTGDPTLPSGLRGCRLHAVHRFTCRQNTHSHYKEKQTQNLLPVSEVGKRRL